jgi:hypothetical protein
LDKLIQIAEQFNTNGPVVSAREYGTGNVNDTYLVTLDAPGKNKCFIMQRINRHVFRQPELIMLNMSALSDHVQARLEKENHTDAGTRRWIMPRVFHSKDGHSFYRDENNDFWRAMSFIDHSTAYPRIRDAQHAAEAGYALGRFQSLISDMRVDQMHDTLVGFHITPGYLQHYDEVLARDGVSGAENGSADERHCKAFVAQRRKFAHVLEDAKASGRLPLRPMHGDPKIDNIMIDDETSKAISIIDLDTVKPGLVHYDIGDCLRSCCNPLGEETADLSHVCFDLDLCHEILRGYLSVASAFFNTSDYDYLYDAIRLIAFELGLRFFTDHLEGNVYFKARHPEHNLHRALVQFKLVESIEHQESDLQKIVREMK